MKYLVSLLLAMAAGCGMYALGAILWAVADPAGAGASLLFTIPAALGAMAISGLLGTIALATRCNWDCPAEPDRSQPARAQTEPVRPPLAVSPRPVPQRPASRRPVARPAPQLAEPGLELCAA